MKKISFFLILFLTACLSSVIYSQTGVLTGSITDEVTNDVLPFTDIIIKGTQKGTSSDFDGKYSIELDPGIYTIQFSFVGYTTVEIEKVEIKGGKETLLNALLKPSSGTLGEVVITTTVRKNTEKAIVNLQKKSAVVIDGLSPDAIKKSGAVNVATAIRQVPGVTIEGGKFIVVRGLSDRYTKTTLNGLDVPGLDPDKNSLEVSLFPTTILENLVVSKTASADLPADFTGGVADITLKDFPSKKEFSVTAGVGYTVDQHLNSDFLKPTKGDFDFLGFDDGGRDNPVSPNTVIPSLTNQDRINSVNEITNRFDPELRAPRDSNLPNFNLGFTTGNSYELGEGKIGYFANVGYRSQSQFFFNAFDGAFVKDQIDRTSNDLLLQFSNPSQISVQNTLLNGYGGVSYKIKKSKFKFSTLFIKGGETTASFSPFRIRNDDAGAPIGQPNGDFSQADEIKFTEKSILNFFVSGNHRLANDWKFDWKYSPSFSRLFDRDHRTSPLEILSNNELSVNTALANIVRIFRELEEDNHVGKIDFSKKYIVKESKWLAKFGGLIAQKDREFGIANINFGARSSSIPSGNPNVLFSQENIISNNNIDESLRFRVSDVEFEASNQFDASQTTVAGYASNEFGFLENRLKAILGLRVEYFRSIYTGADRAGQIFDEEELIDRTDLFPSANVVYGINDKSNLRLSYARTTARPNFKEGSAAVISDPINDRIFLGALAFGRILSPTFVNNYDLRLEFFGENGDKFSLSSFYKDFDDVIELIFVRGVARQITPFNLDSAEVFGIEFEGIKTLDDIGLKNFRAKFNASIIESNADIGSEELGSRIASARQNADGVNVENISDTRDLQGQAPYVINAALEYSNPDVFTASLNYNVQGETLEIVGVGNTADVFTQPFDNLNFTASKTFNKHSLTVKANNLLGDVRESFFKNAGDEQLFSRRVPNRTFSLGYTYKF